MKPDTARAFGRALAVVTAVGAFLRFWELGHRTFWIDEVFQSFLLHGSWRFMFHTVAQDGVHPPLDYIIDKLWILAGAPPGLWRAPSALWGTLTVPACGLLVRRRLGERAALSGALLLAVLPFHIGISREMRPYSLGLFTMSAALLLLDRAIERPTTGRRVIFAFAAIATLGSLLIAALTLAIAGGGLLLEDAASGDARRRGGARRMLRTVPAIALATVALFAPWALEVRRVAFHHALHGARRPLSLKWLAHSISSFSFSHNGGYSFGPPGFYRGMVALVAITALAGLLATCARPRGRFLAVWLGGGILAIVALAPFSAYAASPRYFVAATVAFPFAVGVGVDALARWHRGLAAALVALLTGFALTSVLVGRSGEGNADWTRLFHYLRRVPPSAAIYADSRNSMYQLANHFCGPEWFSNGYRCVRPLVDLEGDASGLPKNPRARAWLVLTGARESEAIRSATSADPEIQFPEAEGCVVRRLGGGPAQ